jgi:hypothetical protein
VVNQQPDVTAKELFERLQAQMPAPFESGHLRTLQRRVMDWRTAIVRRLVLGVNGEATVYSRSVRVGRNLMDDNENAWTVSKPNAGACKIGGWGGQHAETLNAIGLLAPEANKSTRLPLTLSIVLAHQ